MKQGFIYAIEIAEWVKIGWSAAYNRVAVTNLTQMLHHYNILNLSDISESPIRALRNRCSDPTPIEQRRGAVRRLGFAPIPGRRSNSIPKRTSATQSRPMEKAAAGGMSARQVGFPAGGHRTAAAFSSVVGCRHQFSNPGASRGERAAWEATASTIAVGGGKRHAAVGLQAGSGQSPLSRPYMAETYRGNKPRQGALAGVAPGRARNFSRLSMRGARAGHTPMRAGRGNNDPLMKGRGSVGIGECVSMPMSVALSRWEVNENTPKCHGRPI